MSNKLNKQCVVGKSDVLKVLTAAASVLHIVSASAAEEVNVSGLAAEKLTSNFSYSSLDEDGARYEIDIYQASFDIPLSDTIDFDLAIQHETLSGASPLWTQSKDAFDTAAACVGAPSPLPCGPIPNTGEIVEVRTGATIEETRDEIGFAMNYYGDGKGASVSVEYSTEDDYDSTAISLSGYQEFNQKNTTMRAGVGFSMDDLEPSRGGFFGTVIVPLNNPVFERPLNEDKDTFRAHVGITQLLSPESYVQSTLEYSYQDGYLEDPYKLVYIEECGAQFNFTFRECGGLTSRGLTHELRPDDREALAWSTRYKHNFSNAGVLDLGYRLYDDS